MAWAGSHSQPLTWRRGKEEKDESGNIKANEEKNECGNVIVNSQIVRDSGNSIKIGSLLEFPPLQSKNVEQEINDQEYSFLEDSYEEKDSLSLNFEEKKDSILVEDKKESCLVNFKSLTINCMENNLCNKNINNLKSFIFLKMYGIKYINYNNQCKIQKGLIQHSIELPKKYSPLEYQVIEVLDFPVQQVIWTNEYISNPLVPKVIKIIYLPGQQVLWDEVNVSSNLESNKTKLIFNINEYVNGQKNMYSAPLRRRS